LKRLDPYSFKACPNNVIGQTLTMSVNMAVDEDSIIGVADIEPDPAKLQIRKLSEQSKCT